MKSEKYDLRTPLQRERDERNVKIIDEYRNIKREMPEVTNWTAYRVLAETFGMKTQGIRSIIIRNGAEIKSNN